MHSPDNLISRRPLRGALFATVVATLGLGLLPSGARAQATLISGLGGPAGYGSTSSCLARNDDGYSAVIDLTPYFPGGLQFFSGTHTSLYVNTNGNVTFSGPLSTYTPDAFPVASQPMIAPFWGDVDIRTGDDGTCRGSFGNTCGGECGTCASDPPSYNGVWWYGESGRFIVTWDRVRRYSCEESEANSFQLLLTAASGTCGGGTGDFEVEFRYAQMQWEAGSASGDTNDNGLCDSSESSCVPAQAGFDAGDETNYVAIPGSLESGIHTHLLTSSNVGTTGVWQYQIRSGAVICPEAGDDCDTGGVGVCARGVTNCVGSGTECVPAVSASTETCDSLDNDCDGSVDEDDDLCGSGQVCFRGDCVARCFEGGCASDETCTSDGVCVENACLDVTCADGQRCSGGSCVGACEGVVCPTGQTCTARACVDLCDLLTCDECSVCEAGACVASCDYSPCASGETCQEDGTCLADACVGVECPTGSYCEAGACIDTCADAVCPSGQSCVAGECVSSGGSTETDGGTTTPTDGGSSEVLDGGGSTGTDGGTTSGVDGGSSGGVAAAGDPGCDCRTASRGDLGQLALLLGFALFARRRRRR